MAMNRVPASPLTVTNEEMAKIYEIAEKESARRFQAMTNLDWQRIYDQLNQAIERMPESWQLINRSLDGFMAASKVGLKVMLSGCREDDGKLWMHLSVSRDRIVPNWEQMVAVKNIFLGEDALAVQVFPRKANYINIHKYVLHLWCCLDSDPVPDFSSGTGTI